MAHNYPYIQDEEILNDVECEVCHLMKPQVHRLEWRVDWFQGNCEFEDICQSCKDKREYQQKKKDEAYSKKMTPIWKKQRDAYQEKLDNFDEVMASHGIEVKKHDNGQYTFNNALDWWSTTGTAIARKSRNRYQLYLGNPEQIVEILQTEVTHNPAQLN